MSEIASTYHYDSDGCEYCPNDITHDSIGRFLCKEHRRETCHQCLLTFHHCNRRIERDAGLIRKKSEVENVAEDYVDHLSELEMQMEYGDQDDDEDMKQQLKDTEDKLRRLANEGKDVESAKRVAMQAKRNSDVFEANDYIVGGAMMQVWREQKSGNSYCHDARSIYYQVAARPPIDLNLADMYTCTYCKYVSRVKLTYCDRCKKASYCSKTCQKASWKAHKKECIPSEKAAKSLPLTWAQVQAYEGLPVEGGILEVRAMFDTKAGVVFFTDRVGDVRRVAGSFARCPSFLPDLKQGSILKWKNPRLHYFMDGSNGARIEFEDLVNITVTN